MKKVLILLAASLIFWHGLAQSTREELERNHVKLVTITGWIRSNDGTLIEKPDKMRVEHEYDQRGNNTTTVVFISYKNTKHDSIHYSYDHANRCTEVVTYEFAQTKALFIGREKKIYDERGNILFHSTENSQGLNECQYSYRFDNLHRLIEKTTTCNGKKESSQTISYNFDKKGNVIMESRTGSSPVKYIIKYFKGSDKIESRLNLSNSKQEFFDQNGALVKVTEPGFTKSYKYDQRGNIIELTEDNWQSSITGARVYKQVFDQGNHLIEKMEVSGKSVTDPPEKWVYSSAGLPIEYVKGQEIEKYEYQFYN